jgi:histidinol-phosphatase (PHP family)
LYVYGRYLETILHALEHCNGFDIVGHFDYISRFAPYQDKKMYYKDFPDLFDAIFLQCIQKNKALEFNTRTSYQFKSEKMIDYMPDPVIFSRYRELGGELIAFGSDAHQVESIMALENDAKIFLLNAGFRHTVYFKQRKPFYLLIQD